MVFHSRFVEAQFMRDLQVAEAVRQPAEQVSFATRKCVQWQRPRRGTPVGMGRVLTVATAGVRGCPSADNRSGLGRRPRSTG